MSYSDVREDQVAVEDHHAYPRDVRVRWLVSFGHVLQQTAEAALLLVHHVGLVVLNLVVNDVQVASKVASLEEVHL